MARDSTAESFAKHLPLGSKVPASHVREDLGIGFTLGEGVQDGAAGHPHDVADDGVQLDVRVL